jgi:hypothetical protein
MTTDWGAKAREILQERSILVEEGPPLDELLEAAMRVCDRYGDGPEARADMERDCRATPPHLRADLLEHLRLVGAA